MKIFSTLALGLLNLYQSYSKNRPSSCRFYPSCSEYAKWHFSFSNPLRALLLTLFRISRCNGLFEGGIEYPVVRFTPPKITFLYRSNIPYGKIKCSYWLVPCSGGYYLIKDIS